ncbi:MAG TPA: hypothetical protein VF971_08305 [Candidatus Limnocylindrales bacterium]
MTHMTVRPRDCHALGNRRLAESADRDAVLGRAAPGSRAAVGSRALHADARSA